jgi:PncC family amidohydrolase
MLNEHGAVSEPVVRAMAEGALKASGADVAVAVTGIAGPGGATAGKPVGTVCLAWACQGRTAQAVTRLFPGGRDAVRRASALAALDGAIALLRQS